MDIKRIAAGVAAIALAAAAVSCGGKETSTEDSKKETQTTEASTETASETVTEAETETEPETEPETEEELVPPVPAEASDPNSVAFDSDDISFASVINDDSYAAVGTLSVEEVMGNRMLKFTDDMSVPLEGKVQKVSINAAKLLALEDLPKVRSIQLDVYADAVEEHYTSQLTGEILKVPGTINGGGGTVTAAVDSEGNGKWYNFSEFEGGEYNFDMSGPIHVEFKFLLADAGQCWSEEMEDANFLVMRWGSENESNFYIDNIVFYDENGESIPLAE